MTLRATKALATALLAGLAGCSEPPPAPTSPPLTHYYRFPWLEECKASLEARFMQERERNPAFNYQLVFFARSLNPTPALRGYVELSSTEYDEAALGRVADEVIRYCYPVTTRKLALRDRQFLRKLQQTHEIARGFGAPRVYARLSDEHLHLYFPEARPPSKP